VNTNENNFRAVTMGMSINPSTDVACTLSISNVCVVASVKPRFMAETIHNTGSRKWKQQYHLVTPIETIIGVDDNSVEDVVLEVESTNYKLENSTIETALENMPSSYNESKAVTSRLMANTGLRTEELKLIWDMFYTDFMRAKQETENHFTTLVKVYLYYFACIESEAISEYTKEDVEIDIRNYPQLGDFVAQNEDFTDRLRDVKTRCHVSLEGLNFAEGKAMVIMCGTYPNIKYSVCSRGRRYMACASKIVVPERGTTRTTAVGVLERKADAAGYEQADANVILDDPQAIERCLMTYCTRLRLLELMPKAKEMASNIARMSWASEAGINLQVTLPEVAHFRDIIPWAMKGVKSDLPDISLGTSHQTENLIGGALMVDMAFAAAHEMAAHFGALASPDSQFGENPAIYAKEQEMRKKQFFENIACTRVVTRDCTLVPDMVQFLFGFRLTTLQMIKTAKNMLYEDVDMFAAMSAKSAVPLLPLAKRVLIGSTASVLYTKRMPECDEMRLGTEASRNGYLLARFFKMKGATFLPYHSGWIGAHVPSDYNFSSETYGYTDGQFWDSEVTVYYEGVNAQSLVEEREFEILPTRGRKPPAARKDRKGKGTVPYPGSEGSEASTHESGSVRGDRPSAPGRDHWELGLQAKPSEDRPVDLSGRPAPQDVSDLKSNEIEIFSHKVPSMRRLTEILDSEKVPKAVDRTVSQSTHKGKIENALARTITKLIEDTRLHKKKGDQAMISFQTYGLTGTGIVVSEELFDYYEMHMGPIYLDFVHLFRPLAERIRHHFGPESAARAAHITWDARQEPIIPRFECILVEGKWHSVEATFEYDEGGFPNYTFQLRGEVCEPFAVEDWLPKI